MKAAFPLFLFLIFATSLSAQTVSVRRAEALADSLYAAHNYPPAAPYYMQVARQADFKNGRSNAAYNAACCYALAGNIDSALASLQLAVKLGYNQVKHMSKDSDLDTLRSLPAYQSLVAGIVPPPPVNTDPKKLSIVTSDIHRFWRAYDSAAGDDKRMAKYMREIYFDSATVGMSDYMTTKVGSITSFLWHLRKHPKFYATVRQNTLAADRYAGKMRASFVKLKKLYPAAQFPDLYFVIGSFNSAGTVSSNGLLMGINQMCGGPGVDTSELSAATNMLMSKSENLPNIVVHELIHFQQDGMKSDTTNLKYAILEGMADFLAEVITGEVVNEGLHNWAKGQEKRIWTRFKKEMYENNYSGWIGNALAMPAGEYADQGYWVGYQICRSYYEQMKDKKQAVYDMLHIQDYPAFLAKSKWEEKIAGM